MLYFRPDRNHRILEFSSVMRSILDREPAIAEISFLPPNSSIAVQFNRLQDIVQEMRINLGLQCNRLMHFSK